MASNDQTEYTNLSTAPDLDQKTLNKMAWRSCFLQASFNYERMQAAGWLYSILPGLEKIHTDKDDLATSMSHNMEFFNIHPFLVTFAMGLVLSMEQKKIDIPTIRAVRVSLMGPLGGIGDALFWMTLVPISAGICSNMAIGGSIFGPILFLIIFNAVQFALRFGLMNWSYKMGMDALDSLMASMKAFTRAASILGVFVVGCLTVAMGPTQINAVIPNGTTESYMAHTVTLPTEEVDGMLDMVYADPSAAEPTALVSADGISAGVNDLGNGYAEVTYMEKVTSPVNISIANILDSICPKLVPLSIVMLLYYLFSKKNFTPMKGIVLVLIIGILGAGPFGLWPSIWG